MRRCSACFGDPDFGPIYSGYFGLLLFGAALVGTGLLASALTANQVIAALISLSVFLLLWIIDNFGWLLPSPCDTLVVNLSLSVHFKPVRRRLDLSFGCRLLPERHAADAAAERARAGAALRKDADAQARPIRYCWSPPSLPPPLRFGGLGFAGFTDDPPIVSCSWPGR